MHQGRAVGQRRMGAQEAGEIDLVLLLLRDAIEELGKAARSDTGTVQQIERGTVGLRLVVPAIIQHQHHGADGAHIAADAGDNELDAG